MLFKIKTENMYLNLVIHMFLTGILLGIYNQFTRREREGEKKKILAVYNKLPRARGKGQIMPRGGGGGGG